MAYTMSIVQDKLSLQNIIAPYLKTVFKFKNDKYNPNNQVCKFKYKY